MACYAVWDSGIISVRSTLYDVETTIAKVQAVPACDGVREDLVTLLRHGHLTDAGIPDAPATVSMN